MEIVEESKYKYKVDGEAVYYLRNDLTAKPPLVSDHFDKNFKRACSQTCD